MKLIALGWQSYKTTLLSKKSAEEIQDIRIAYYAGCSILFSSMMRILDSDDDVTSKDLRMMSYLAKEIGDFDASFDAIAEMRYGVVPKKP